MDHSCVRTGKVPGYKLGSTQVEITAKLARAASEFRVDIGQALRCRVSPVKLDFV